MMEFGQYPNLVAAAWVYGFSDFHQPSLGRFRTRHVGLGPFIIYVHFSTNFFLARIVTTFPCLWCQHVLLEHYENLLAIPAINVTSCWQDKLSPPALTTRSLYQYFWIEIKIQPFSDSELIDYFRPRIIWLLICHQRSRIPLHGRKSLTSARFASCALNKYFYHGVVDTW